MADDTPHEVIARRIRMELGRLDSTKTELAREIDLSSAALNYRMRGMTDWSLDELIRVSYALEIPFRHLLKDLLDLEEREGRLSHSRSFQRTA